MIFLALLLLVSAAQADTVMEQSNILQHARAKVYLTKDASATVGCDLWLQDILAGEEIELSAWVPITNDIAKIAPPGIVVGVTVEITDCTTDCYPNALRFAPQSSWYDGGNLEPEDHHGVYGPTARYVAADYVPALHFTAMVYAYSSQAKAYLTINACEIRAVRHRP